MSKVGGVERHFTDFIALSTAKGLRNEVLAAGSSADSRILERVIPFAKVTHEKYVHGFKIPSKPAFLRRVYAEKVITTADPAILLLWNRPVRNKTIERSMKNRLWAYWEHGAAWFDNGPVQGRFYDDAGLIIANSNAAKRMLQLYWNCKSEIKVCLNALSPRLHTLSEAAPDKNYNDIDARPIRLGFAGRLLDIKGIPIALHALKQLQTRGVSAELHIAGQGGLGDKLVKLAEKLGISKQIIWHGLLDDMSGFYRHIDCLLHPALREPFGLVCIEAAAYGCPVIASRIDGLAESVIHDRTGFCLPPDMDLQGYADIGGNVDNIPGHVYFPDSDTINQPKFISPQSLADAITRLFSSAEHVSRLSASAKQTVSERFGFDRHVDDVIRTIHSYIQNKR